MTTFRVDGMTCDGCAAAIERIVRARDAAATVAVDRAKGLVTLETSTDLAALKAAIAAAGYDVGAA